jgi:hypothetical protein
MNGVGLVTGGASGVSLSFSLLADTC